MLQKPNVLAVDDATNHLDLESINAFDIALHKYEGTLLLVTHMTICLKNGDADLAYRRKHDRRFPPERTSLVRLSGLNPGPDLLPPLKWDGIWVYEKK